MLTSAFLLSFFQDRLWWSLAQRRSKVVLYALFLAILVNFQKRVSTCLLYIKAHVRVSVENLLKEGLCCGPLSITQSKKSCE